MGQKSRKKLDVLMVILMIVVMSYQATGNLFHEAAGVLLLALFIIHNILNRNWYRNIRGGKYSGLSQSIFGSLLGMREAYLIRPWHVAAGVWGLILISFHGGLHIRIPGEKRLCMGLAESCVQYSESGRSMFWICRTG